ncbi:MAG: rhodanese-related sulfurtransferase [uncultured bacterium]|nr:MAG: rhodanese-related sulfurtransferase [uncultured bacterium]
MTVENAIRVMAGSMILLSLYLTWYINPMWVWLTVFVALNLIQSAFTGWCPAVFFLRKLGCKDSCQSG